MIPGGGDEGGENELRIDPALLDPARMDEIRIVSGSARVTPRSPRGVAAAVDQARRKMVEYADRLGEGWVPDGPVEVTVTCEWRWKKASPGGEKASERGEETDDGDEAANPAGVTRIDRYTVRVAGVHVRADPDQEEKLRAMTVAEQIRFAGIFGGTE